MKEDAERGETNRFCPRGNNNASERLESCNFLDDLQIGARVRDSELAKFSRQFCTNLWSCKCNFFFINLTNYNKCYLYSSFLLQLTSLSKTLSHEKAPNLRNMTVLPLLLSPEKDEELMRLTEGRITTFAHDLVPDYLRTKPEPQAEQKMMQLEAKASNLNYDASHVSKRA